MFAQLRIAATASPQCIGYGFPNVRVNVLGRNMKR